MNIHNLWREPLVHFLLIGAAIFVFYGMTRDVSSEMPNRIVVTSGQMEQLADNFRRTWMRQPTKKEMDVLVENHVREEIFYREALAMGLDQDDPMVRRRMRMKLEFILEDLSSQVVTDEALLTYLQENRDKFQSEAQVSFQQVYLNYEKRSDLEKDAKQLLHKLKNGASAESMGDPTLISDNYELETQSELARTFGDAFAAEVIKLSPGDWTGPVYSEFGAHLIKVSERIETQQPELVEIRDLVKREYLAELTKKQKDLAYQQLRKGYEVSIESDNTDTMDDLISTAQASGK